MIEPLIPLNIFGRIMAEAVLLAVFVIQILGFVSLFIQSVRLVFLTAVNRERAHYWRSFILGILGTIFLLILENEAMFQASDIIR